jgi:hypothetical protein
MKKTNSTKLPLRYSRNAKFKIVPNRAELPKQSRLISAYRRKIGLVGLKSLDYVEN